MIAARFDTFDESLATLRVADVPDPVAGSGDVIVRIEASSINPSDIKNVQGRMEGTTLPRTPGRDFAGTIVYGPAHLLGVPVWGAGGDIGFTRDGAHAELLVLPQGGVRRKPEALAMDEAAAVGVNFITAFAALEAADVKPGDVVLIVGASGGVGTAAVQLARWRGATTIGVGRRPLSDDLSEALRPDRYALVGDDLVAFVQRETGGVGADAAIDAVGEPLLSTTMNTLRPGGRWALFATAGARAATVDILDFYHKELRLVGVDSRRLDTVASAAILERLARGFATGALAPPRITNRYALGDAVQAYRSVAGGSARKAVFIA